MDDDGAFKSDFTDYCDEGGVFLGLAEASASSTPRQDQQPVEPPETGPLLAYWRWTVRSHKKRGGYTIARYLGRGPDNSSYWIQSGGQTIKVAPNQVRNAFGYEESVPTREDVRALRNAEEKIRDDVWQDERLPPEAQPPLPEEEPKIPSADCHSHAAERHSERFWKES